MTPPLVLLYTRDHAFDQVLARALFGTGTIILIARSVGDAVQIVCHQGRELDLAVLDLNDGSRGMALLSALYIRVATDYLLWSSLRKTWSTTVQLPTQTALAFVSPNRCRPRCSPTQLQIYIHYTRNW